MKNVFENWSDVRVFLAVLRHGSTLAASKQLCMSQPTVARRIEALESVLSLTLFERDTRGFQPTQDAQSLREKAEAMEAAAEAFHDSAERLGPRNTRTIRLTAPTHNFTENLTNLLAEFTDQNPGTTFEFISTPRYVDLLAGEADVAVRIAREITDDRLICRQISNATASLYASDSYVSRHGMPKSMDDLEGHRFVIIDRGPDTLPLNQKLVSMIRPDQITSRCTDLDSLIAATKAGLGIGPIPTSLARDFPALQLCFEPPEGLSIPLWLLVGPDAWRRPEVKAFVRFFGPRYAALFRKHG